jgi:subtilisin family serine protease
MSTPVVTGAAALYFQQNPNATYAEVLAALTAQTRADEMTSGFLPNND